MSADQTYLEFAPDDSIPCVTNQVSFPSIGMSLVVMGYRYGKARATPLCFKHIVQK